MSAADTREGQMIQRLAEAQATRMWRNHLARCREREPVREARGTDDAVAAFAESYDSQTSRMSWP